MRLAWPAFDTRVEGSRLIARGQLRPSPAHREYRVRVEYQAGCLPLVYVEDPPLVPREPRGKIPHVYPGPRPCIFYPATNEWTSSMRIAETIVSWLMRWLFHYEVWLMTGTWHGGGIEHDSAKS